MLIENEKGQPTAINPGGQAARPPEQPRLRPAKTPSAGWANLRKVLRYALQQASEKRLAQVASSLTFTTVLSLVPLLTVVLSLFTAFPLFDDFRMALQNFLTSNLMPPSVSDNVMLYLNQFAASASGLTAIGSLFLIVTSVSLIMTIDEAFNSIWQVERQRPLKQRVLVYWAIVSLGPILTGASLWATGMLTAASFGEVSDLPAALQLALSIVPVLLVGLAFTLLFVGVPNRQVLWRDAAVGGFLTAIILELMRTGFAIYLTRFPSYTVIYGAFATLPIFLMWLYLSWLVILLGATVAATLPALRQRRWAVTHYTGGSFIDAVRVLETLWGAQGDVPPGRSMGFLCAHLHLHQDELRPVLVCLKRLGYVVNTDGTDEDQWVLACDQRHATLTPLVDAMLLDRRHPELLRRPHLATAIANTIAGQPIALQRLFENPRATGLRSDDAK